MLAVKTENLGRTYRINDNKKEIIALSGVNLEIEEGEVRGLLGPNGAGNTTLIKILSTLLLPSSGQAFIMGHDVVKETEIVRGLIGIVLGGDRGFYSQLTPRETLEYWAALYRVPVKVTKSRVTELLEKVGLLERANSRVETLSRGMKQRLHLARGLVANARVLFLDEPTIGMDPVAAHDFRKLIKELQGEGRTILLATHDMVEAEVLCNKVTLIDKGQVLAVETPETLSQLVSKYERIDYEHSDEALRGKLMQLPGVSSVAEIGTGGGNRIELDSSSAIKDVMLFLLSSGVTNLRTSRPTLEEVYLHLIR